MELNSQPPSQRGMVRRLDGCDATLAIDTPPDPGSVLVTRVERATNALVAFDTQVASIKRNQHLSPSGREDALANLEPERAKVLALVDKAEEDARTVEFLATELEAAVFEVPALEPVDVNARMDDAEIRAWYASLSGDQRRRTLDDIAAGKNPRHALALARSPVPTVEAQMGLAAVRANLPPKDRETLQGVAAQKAAIEWTRSATGAIRNALAKRHYGATT